MVDTGTVTLTGYASEWNAKCGVRWMHIEVDKPYLHTAIIEVSGEELNWDDDDINEKLGPFSTGRISVLCNIKGGELFAEPSGFSHAPTEEG